MYFLLFYAIVYFFTNLNSCYLNFPCWTIPEKRVDELGSVVAFHVEMGPNKNNFNKQRSILLEWVKQNFGNTYDPQLGVFTCPKSGLYFFTFTMTKIGETLETKLVVSGSPIAYAQLHIQGESQQLKIQELNQSLYLYIWVIGFG